MAGEDWRRVAFAPDYDVSDLGRVRSRKHRRDGEPRILRGSLDVRGHGYIYVSLHTLTGVRFVAVHRLVGETFFGPLPDGLQTRHLDGNPGNNALANLRHGTRSENMRDQLRHGTHAMANRTHCPQGHAYDEANTELRYGRRFCLACRRARSAEYTARRRNRRNVDKLTASLKAVNAIEAAS